MADALIENIKDCPWWRCRDSGECRGVTFGGCRDQDAIEAFLADHADVDTNVDNGGQHV